MSAAEPLHLHADPDPDPTVTEADLHGRPEAGRPASLVAGLEPFLVPTLAAARLSGISVAAWHRLKSAAKTPEPIRLGGKVLYRLSDLKLWVSLGCPDRRTFAAHQAARKDRP
jgi:hypothetical protein